MKFPIYSNDLKCARFICVHELHQHVMICHRRSTSLLSLNQFSIYKTGIIRACMGSAASSGDETPRGGGGSTI
ncbi:hypothetical protein RJT34_32036 [Clitoria ternatea]|uniref:Uncharacterized protein n=1 Tax=Clitoria ternatea TaxID=43366 RepID=A0AAN9I3D3_CLITE